MKKQLKKVVNRQALITLTLLTMSADALAAGNAIESGLQSLIDLLNGGVARSIAIIAVIGFGIGALTGRIDWTRALQVILAIGIIFGAATLVDMFAG
ncbi:TrbC/VirB2 family protein [Methylocaldum sp. RMAD-M]|uniref:TrbC/VirB2 family protein n=1 Tax=Methylocaldum sp. RMAD-M TaxID=2806557 RepID=UPI001AE788F1|nr:TrbC/VirB2 family protein [Methylocaldum sp. RMAD-M]MBP1152524.1 type IV secretion system protein VirB2 [Methylocaldum sp. RMAD-M]